ncbi:HAMP domain-containing sensor histidine kinase [Thermopolyspora sp. NPDC052614]|uniref:HAMP domain-containing sensor histidine kinase n=1 Tax=Thermopolyspora sp. NPDC052614 TaxID=3155682 RepID=UPI0034182FD8
MRRSLVLLAVACTAMVTLAFLVPLAMVVREAARSRAIAEGERQAAALVPVLAITTDPGRLDHALASFGDGRRVAVHLPDGGTLGTPRASASWLAEATRRNRAVTVEFGGGRLLLRPVVLGGGRGAVIEVYVPPEALTRGVGRSWAVLAVLAVVLVVGSVLVTDRLGTRLVRATRRLGSAAASLGAGDLSVRVEPAGPPELVAAGRAFNAMADQVVALLAAERELAADLSHRLRTPLTALRLSLGRLGPDAEPSRQALDRLEHEVDAIIAATRASARRAYATGAEGAAGRTLGGGDRADARDGGAYGAGSGAVRHGGRSGSSGGRGSSGGAGGGLVDGMGVSEGAVRWAGDGLGNALGSCDAAEVLRERLEFWSALAEDQGRPWDLVGVGSPVRVPVPATELTAVVDALLGNVFRHTSEGTAFTVTLHEGTDTVGILVADAGPGIPDPDAALRRGASGAGSTGLGLDIARRLAESTGGSVKIDRSPVLGGATVQLWLRTAPPDASGPRRARRRVRS